MDRREFLQRSGAVAAGGMLASLGIFEQAAAAAAAAQPGQRPNIVFILVDEMRFPTAFPAGISTPEQYIQRFMPNLAELWKRGVVFDRYYSAGNACSPARATLATGLYPHQEWLLATRTTAGPALQTAFPTYGRLLRSFGYRTPYIGKCTCRTRRRAARPATSRTTASRASRTRTRSARTGRAPTTTATSPTRR